jgi:site-specific recombinase XerD
MRYRPLDAFEINIVEMVRENFGAHEAKHVRELLPRLTELLAGRKVTILTALPGDLEAFCEERARTRKPSSMARLIGSVRHIFEALCQSGLRNDNPSRTLLPPRTRATAARARRSRPSSLETRLLEIIRDRVSVNQAKLVRKILLRLTEFLRRRKLTLLTAVAEDLEAFCDARARTWKPSSVACLVNAVQTVFKTLLEAGLRNYDPSVNLKRPRMSTWSAEFSIEQRVVEQVERVFAEVSSYARQTTGHQAFVAARFLAILHLVTAGALCSEIAALSISDVERAAISNGPIYLARGSHRERRVVLTFSGYTSLASYLALRRARAGPEPDALFISVRTPYRRLPPESVSDDIRLAIRAAGASGCGLTGVKLRRMLPATIVSEGHGWAMAATLAGYKHIPRTNFRSFNIAQLADLIERHHPMGRPNRQTAR